MIQVYNTKLKNFKNELAVYPFGIGRLAAVIAKLTIEDPSAVFTGDHNDSDFVAYIILMRRNEQVSLLPVFKVRKIL